MVGDGGASWSPDGQTLALPVLRTDHAFIALWRRGDLTVSWLSPSLDTDGYPRWSGDGGRLAFLRFRADSDEHDVQLRSRGTQGVR